MPSSRSSQETPPIQSLDRGLTILSAVAGADGPVSLSELTAVIGIDRSSVFRLANTLKRRGFLASPAGRKDYILGPAIWRLSHHYDWGKTLARVASEHLKYLARQANETAHLAVREGKQALFIDHAGGNQVISVSGQTGETVPLYCTAHGKALLADMSQVELARLLGADALVPYSRETIRSIADLAKACAEIRVTGCARDNGEYRDGLRCVAAPIRAEDGKIIGSIGISAPTDRMTPSHYQDCATLVMEVARDISIALRSESSADKNGDGNSNGTK